MSLRLPPDEHHGRTRSSPLTIELLPPGSAYDFEFVAARLHDPSLLRAAVSVRIFKAPLLAVPVGGCRRGGRLNAGPLTIALAVRGALEGRDGFPHLRVNESARLGDWYVEWGEQAPQYPGRSPELQRFFGYTPPGTSPHCTGLASDTAAVAGTSSGFDDERSPRPEPTSRRGSTDDQP